MKILKNWGNLKSAQTWKDEHGNSKTVRRVEKIWIEDYSGFVPCAPYDNHFIFENPDKRKGTYSFLCTCGSNAIVVGSNVYAGNASPAGLMFVCQAHSTHGKHLDKSS